MEVSLIGLALGAVVGLILALTGAGGGILAVPLLVFGLHLTIMQAAPVGLIAVGSASAIGAALELRAGFVRYRAATVIGLIGMALAPAGVSLARVVPNGPLLVAFAVVLFYVAARTWMQSLRTVGLHPDVARSRPPCLLNPIDGRLTWTTPCMCVMAATGAVSGLLSGLLGVGGGFVIVPALLRVSDLDMPSVSVTSMSVIALVAVASIAIYGYAGQEIDWRIAAPFAAGALAGVLGGRQLARRLPGARLQQAFACIGLIVVAMLLWRSLARA